MTGTQLTLATDNYPGHAQDIMQLMEAIKGNGTYVGLTVAEQAVPNNTVQVTSGRFAKAGTILNSAGTASIALDNAHATLPRIDLIQVDTSAGAPYVTKLTGTASPNPVRPNPDTNAIAVAYVYVRPTGVAPVINNGDDSTNAYIVDARCYCPVRMGSASISSGQTSVTVSDASVTALSKVFLQPTTTSKSSHPHTFPIAFNATFDASVGIKSGILVQSPGSSTQNVTGAAAENWYVDTLVAGTSFRINVPVATTATMSFNYMIVG